MRFMVQVRATPETEAGVMPSEALMTAMMAFNQGLADAGVLVAADGLKDSSAGARMHWTNGVLSVIDGPFAETKELIAGFWIIKAESKAQVIDLFRNCPPVHDDGNGLIEIRQVFEMEDFPESSLSPQTKAAEERLRGQLEGQGG